MKKLETTFYEDISSEEVLERLKQISEIEIMRMDKGVFHAGLVKEYGESYFVPALAYPHRIGERIEPGLVEASGIWKEYKFKHMHGYTIQARRIPMNLPKKIRHILKLPMSESDQRIDDIVEFVEEKMGIPAYRKITEKEYHEKRHLSNLYARPYLQYLKKIGELNRKVTLYTEDFEEKDIHLNSYKGHLVIPTTILFLT